MACMLRLTFPKESPLGSLTHLSVEIEDIFIFGPCPIFHRVKSLSIVICMISLVLYFLLSFFTRIAISSVEPEAFLFFIIISASRFDILFIVFFLALMRVVLVNM